MYNQNICRGGEIVSSIVLSKVKSMPLPTKISSTFHQHICVSVGNTMSISFSILHTSSECIDIVDYILMSHSILNPTF